MALGKELVDLDQAFDKRLHLIYFFSIRVQLPQHVAHTPTEFRIFDINRQKVFFHR